MEENKKERDFATFRKRLKKVEQPKPFIIQNDRYSYSRFGSSFSGDSVRKDFSLEEIGEIIRDGDLSTMRLLSKHAYRTNSLYRNNIDFLANLPLYDTMVIPYSSLEKKGSERLILKAFEQACSFIDALDVPTTFANITTEWLKTGVFNGILRKDGDLVTIQNLPIEYCRTRFKDFNNFNILEFNLNYFLRILEKETRELVIQSFPDFIQKAWEEWQNNPDEISCWVPIPAVEGGICFCFTDDPTPPLLASLQQLKKLDDAVKREETRDESGLYKLLIQKMPIDKNGELVFELPEVAEIHASVAEMLKDVETVEVLTTFGDTSLESLQENSAASQSADRIDKYRKNAWSALGRGELLFNPDGSSSLAYAIKKDEAFMIKYLNVYEHWLKFILNEEFSRLGVNFDFEILPTTVFNRQDLQNTYFRGAQYGYSKMFAGVSMGMKQISQLSLMDFENEFLQMHEKMIPLRSSYTTSEKNNSSEEKNKGNALRNNIDNVGGRPELPDEQKSEKTQANIAAQG